MDPIYKALSRFSFSIEGFALSEERYFVQPSLPPFWHPVTGPCEITKTGPLATHSTTLKGRQVFSILAGSAENFIHTALPSIIFLCPAVLSLLPHRCVSYFIFF